MVTKKKTGVFGEGEIKPFTEEELKTWKWPIRIFLVVATVLLIGWFVYTTPGLMPAKTSGDALGKGPPSGDAAKIPPIVTGTATPTPTKGQEKIATYVPKYNPSGPTNPTGTTVQEVALNNLPEKLLIARNGIVYIKNLKVEGNYLYGDLVSTVDITGEDVKVAFLDKNGNHITKAGISGLLFGGYEYEGGKKLNIYEEYPTGPINLKKGKERYFRVLIPKGAVYIQTIRR